MKSHRPNLNEKAIHVFTDMVGLNLSFYFFYLHSLFFLSFILY